MAGCPENTGDTYRCELHAAAHRAAEHLSYQAHLARRAADAEPSR